MKRPAKTNAEHNSIYRAKRKAEGGQRLEKERKRLKEKVDKFKQRLAEMTVEQQTEYKAKRAQQKQKQRENNKLVDDVIAAGEAIWDILGRSGPVALPPTPGLLVEKRLLDAASTAQAAASAALAAATDPVNEALKKKLLQRADIASQVATTAFAAASALDKTVETAELSAAITLASFSHDMYQTDKTTPAPASFSAHLDSAHLDKTDKTTPASSQEAILAQQMTSTLKSMENQEMMVYVPPDDTSASDTVCALHILKSWDALFTQRKVEVIAHLESLRKGNGTGVRTINGGRYELFLDPVDEKGTEAVDWVCTEAGSMENDHALAIRDYPPKMIREKVVAFANKQASKERRMRAGLNYKLKSHALIVSFGKVKAQDMHIDLDDPRHFQFGMICSHNVPATLEFKATGAVIGPGNDLGKVWKAMPEELAVKIKQNRDCQGLLEAHGCLLSKCVSVQSNHVPNCLPLGSLLSLPGGVPHAGPASPSSCVRAVLFFTGAPIDAPGYNVDYQYCRTTLIGDIIMYTWLDMTAPEREYMLTRWLEEGLSKDANGLASMGHRVLSQIGKAIMKKATWKKTKKRRLAIIKAIAHDPLWDEEKHQACWLKDDPNLIYVVPKK
jgi:hypothetical protein